MEENLFTKIIRGEIPSHKIYEDEWVYAFLDIKPVQRGHVLVVPRKPVDRIENMEYNEYVEFMVGVRKVMRHMAEVFAKPITVKVEGFDVPYAHVHLIPAENAAQYNAQPTDASDAELAVVAKELYFVNK